MPLAIFNRVIQLVEGLLLGMVIIFHNQHIFVLGLFGNVTVLLAPVRHLYFLRTKTCARNVHPLHFFLLHFDIM